MKIDRFLIMFVVFCHLQAFGQQLTQTVRGQVIDIDSKEPLESATIFIIGSNPNIGAITETDGVFRLENVLIGRVTLHISYLGYDSKTISNIEIISGKETVLNIELEQSISQLDELTVTANQHKGKAINEMVLVSGRSISLDEARRFAGGWDDPSRILSNFAGVTNTQNAENDIIVRGNSPKYIQWRLEGMEISNPTHFADQNSVKGGISALNNNLLATSDFYTGAFSPEYGDVLSGVYDVKLRSGNNEKFEAAFGFGVLGTDITLEGPLAKSYGGSYLINYRYSTIGLVSDLGLVDIAGLLSFQDLTFKINLPAKKAGIFSLFGLGGLSGFSIEDVSPDLWTTPGEEASRADINEDFDKDNHQFNGGINHSIAINRHSFIKSSVTYSRNGIDEDIFQRQKDAEARLISYQSDLVKNTYRFSTSLHLKINAKNKIQLGTKYALWGYEYKQQLRPEFESDDFTTLVDFNERISSLRNFLSWKHRVNDQITIVSGLHNMNLPFVGQSTIEPRFAIDWKINETNNFSAGYGKHSSMESIHNYFARVPLANGNFVEPNRDLKLLKAHHYVLGYEKCFSQNLVLKAEAYYQDLYDIPVENDPESYYSTINESTDFRYVDLVNKGKGKNYGIEITLERFLKNHFYYLVNGSIYDSKYTALDGRERNTLYNGNFILNVLIGKEFVKLGRRNNQILSLNAKAFFGGGQKYIPLLRDAFGNLAVDPKTHQYFDYEKAYDNKLNDITQLTLSASYKFNRTKTTHEIFINLDNLANSKGKLSEYYDESEPNSIGYITQFGFFPNLVYRFYF